VVSLDLVFLDIVGEKAEGLRSAARVGEQRSTLHVMCGWWMLVDLVKEEMEWPSVLSTIEQTHDQKA
jgi:hypothetical protein